MKILLLDIAWLAGILEGEGSFMLKTTRGPNGTICISLQMSDKDIVRKCAQILNTKLYGPYISKQKRQDGSSKKETWMISIFGSKAASWMMTIFSFMGNRRKEKIEFLLRHWKTQVSMNGKVKPTCHPNRKYHSKNMCSSCYMKAWHRGKEIAHTSS